MSPMCMHSAGEDGFVTDWHRVHYGARAQGQVGLIFPETLAVHKDARIGEGDLGIWVAARRALEAGFDVLEIHTAHGYLLNEFLSPLANTRDDEYGGDAKRRYRILGEIIEEVKLVWGERPLFVRISSTDYTEGGNTPESFLEYGRWMKEQGVDLIDCSSGGIKMIKVHAYPGYQVPAAQLLRKEVGIATGAVGLIQNGRQAEEILQNGRADLIFVGRQMLRDPFWVRSAADDLKETIDIPAQYTRYGVVWLDTKPSA